jgi:predicted RNA-binding Zn ribbon-like protein
MARRYSEPSRPLSSDGNLPLRFVGGAPSIDLVNTVDWTSRGPDHDRLVSYPRLIEWSTGAGVLASSETRALARTAVADPSAADAALEQAFGLRWTLQRLFVAVAHEDQAAAAKPLEELNLYLANALAHLRLAAARRRSGVNDDDGGRFKWEWQEADTHLESPLWPVVQSAAELLVSDEVHRIRVCDAPECGWMYVDRSRNGLRRWCQMETCGTREKTRRRRKTG